LGGRNHDHGVAGGEQDRCGGEDRGDDERGGTVAEVHSRGEVTTGTECGNEGAGALTPSEILRAMALGAAAVKLFPVSAVGGLQFVRAVLEPIRDARFVVSGEVTLPEVDADLSAGAWAACIGPGLWRAEDLERDDIDAVTRYARQALRQVSSLSATVGVR
jgi:hypothetical protein